MLLKLFLLYISVCITISFQPPWMFMGRPLSGFRQIDTVELNNPPNPEWFEQYLDHFGKIGTKWKQRYWKNDDFADGNGLQFLFLGGESVASAYDVFYEKIPHVQYAKEMNASLWTLEHRFYGESQPFDNLKTENFKYLKSHQALADIAYFIKYQNLNLTNPRWIIFGGSYAGTLALWFRKLHPDLSVGVVASSAPVDLRLDFYDHLQYIEYQIELYDPKCKENIKNSFKDFERNITGNGNAKILMDMVFNFNPSIAKIDITYESIGYIYSTIISYFQTAVQYNNVNTKIFNSNVGVSTLCKNMELTYYNKTSYLSLKNAIDNMTTYLRGSYDGIDIDYTDFISYLQDYNSSDSQQRSTRAWTWQVCNEFGNFISTNGRRSIFGNHVSYNFYIGVCIDAFGEKYSIINTQYGLQRIKQNYGFSSTYTGTNVIASKNSYDPWSLLALVKPNDLSIITYDINDTGHCADMAPISDDDNESLVKYRKIVLKTIKKWVGTL